MQIISIEDLKKLANSNVNEASIFSVFGSKDDQLAEGVSFRDLEAKWKKTSKSSQQQKFKEFSDNVLKYIVPPIKLVGSGSSRTAFACAGGKCLKVAMTDAGIQQNKQEYALTKKKLWSKSWPCFSQSYGINNDGSLLVVECCSLATDTDKLAKDLDVDTWETWNIMLKMIYKMASEGRKDFVSSAVEDLDNILDRLKTKRKDLEKSSENYSIYVVAALKKFNNIKEGKTNSVGQKIVASLFDFWQKNGVDSLLPSDCGGVDNWGYAIRYGEVAPVLLDAGFSKDIAKKYYGGVF